MDLSCLNVLILVKWQFVLTVMVYFLNLRRVFNSNFQYFNILSLNVPINIKCNKHIFKFKKKEKHWNSVKI